MPANEDFFIRPGTGPCQDRFWAPASGMTSCPCRLSHEQDDGLLVGHRAAHPGDPPEVLLQPLYPVRGVYHRLDAVVIIQEGQES